MDLLIDDIRDLKADVIARTAAAGTRMLALGGWSTIIFDYDLGGKLTGYDLLGQALENDWLDNLPTIEIVTSNPVGLSRMRQALENYDYEETGKNSLKFRHVQSLYYPSFDTRMS